MSPVRTTRSASGPFSVRSYSSAQSLARSPVAAVGTDGAGARLGAASFGGGAGTSFPFWSVHPYGASGLVPVAPARGLEGSAAALTAAVLESDLVLHPHALINPKMAEAKPIIANITCMPGYLSRRIIGALPHAPL